MEFSDIERILALVKEHDLAEFELEREGLKIRVRKSGGVPTMFHAASPALPLLQATAAPQALPAAAPAAAAGPVGPRLDEEESLELAVVKSPIVGTFYRSPEPGAASFVEVGQRVKKDQVLCIIEAMKLMNEIECDVDGTVVQVFPKNSQPVEFGEQLFAIRVD